VKLPDRINSIIRFIPRGSSVVDVGTDHALLPVYLVREKIAYKVVAGDIKKGPLKAAQKTVSEAGLADFISLRLGNGLEIIEPGEVEVAVIAGMGGSTIKKILRDAENRTKSLKHLVLQPMSDSGILREWLSANGWKIIDEELLKEDSRLYEIIYAVPGTEQYADLEILQIGPRLYEKKHPLLLELLTLQITHYKRTADDMSRSISEDTNIKRELLIEKIRKLEWIAKCLSDARQ
jgi:tRNA (adenine22-N1)-methyltransferase